MRRQWAEVCWKGVRMPAADDYIALYVPANADTTRTAPVKYQWAALTMSHLQTGSGCLRSDQFLMCSHKLSQLLRCILYHNGDRETIICEAVLLCCCCASASYIFLLNVRTDTTQQQEGRQLARQTAGARRCEVASRGQRRFRLLNMREDLRFMLMRNGLEQPTIAAKSPPIAVKNRNEPTNGHLALTGHEG